MEESGKHVPHKGTRSPETDPNEMEVYYLPDRESKITYENAH